MIVWLSTLAAAQAPEELALWQDRLGVVVPKDCQAIGAGGTLRIDCGGSALLLEAASGADPRTAALQRQLDPFAQADVPMSTPSERACTVRGAPGHCLEVTISMPRAVMVIQSAAADGWVATCLSRSSAIPEVCTSVFGP